MKSLRWIIPLFVVMGGAFALYLWTQPASSVPVRKPGYTATTAPKRTEPAAPTTALAEGQALGAGEDPWVKSYDSKTGALASQFRADRYDPQPDNSVSVTAPLAEFFQNDGQVLRIRGTHGRVVLPGEAGQSSDMRKMSGPPSRGDLFDVIIELFKSVDSETAFLRCDVPNVRFDNDTFSIATEGYHDKDGNEIPADRVPVVVTGDYEFKGQGLLIRWNERDRRLQLLEIAHGDSLTILNPSKMGQRGEPVAPATQPGSAAPDPFEGIALVDASDESTKEAVRSAAPKKTAKKSEPAAPPPLPTPVIERDRSTPAYRATFFDNVKVFQADKQIADADLMHVDFAEEGHVSTRPSAEPATQTAVATKPSTRRTSTRPASTRTAATRSAARPNVQAVTRPVAESHATADHPATTRSAHGPATLPAEPITIKWTGKLRVTPPPADVPRLAAGEMAVEMSSQTRAVVLSREGSDIRCGSFRYRSGDDSLTVSKSQAVPIVSLTDADGATLYTDGIDYSGQEKQARLLGAGRADVPLVAAKSTTTQPATAPAEHMLATWSRGCTLFLSGESRETLSFDRARLEGDVTIKHPQLNLASGKLDLDFAHAPAKPVAAGQSKDRAQVTLSKLEATDDVRCAVTDAKGRAQNITSRRLSLDTAKGEDGTLTPRKLVADGIVHAIDGETDLRAGTLVASLVPSTRPSTQPSKSADSSTTQPADGDKFAAVEVESIWAEQDVVFAGADGAHAEAEQLYIAVKDGKPTIDLWGRPAAVGNKTDTVAGPIVKIDPSGGLAEVRGAGTLTSFRSDLSPTTPPADVTANGKTTSSTRAASTRPATKPATTRPVIVAWEDALKVDGPGNRVDVTGGVTITSSQDDGANNVASGKKLTIILRDKPTTQPAATQAFESGGAEADAAKYAKDPKDARDKTGVAGLSGLDTGSFDSKDIVSASLEDGAEIESLLKGSDGALLRRVHLTSPLVRYEAEARRMVVPAPGRLLFQDEQRVATTQPAATAGGGTQFTGLGDFKGVTAFQWEKELAYDEAARRVRMSGKVLIVHQDVVGAGETLEIRASDVTADLDPAAGKDKGDNAGGLASGAKLKSLEAGGGVMVKAPKLQFHGDRIRFDPANDLLVATGSEAYPVELYDDRGATKGTFSELRYNTRTQQMALKGLRAGVRR